MINHIIKFTIHVKEGDLYCSDDVIPIRVVVPCVGCSKKQATKHLLQLKKEHTSLFRYHNCKYYCYEL